jgi:hypothetical protein
MHYQQHRDAVRDCTVLLGGVQTLGAIHSANSVFTQIKPAIEARAKCS